MRSHFSVRNSLLLPGSYLRSSHCCQSWVPQNNSSSSLDSDTSPQAGPWELSTVTTLWGHRPFFLAIDFLVLRKKETFLIILVPNMSLLTFPTVSLAGSLQSISTLCPEGIFKSGSITSNGFWVTPNILLLWSFLSLRLDLGFLLPSGSQTFTNTDSHNLSLIFVTLDTTLPYYYFCSPTLCITTLISWLSS